MTAIQPFRPHDFVYDPLFVVSGERDFYKQAMIARLTTAKFQICPIFVNMFSDLPTHPRKRLIMRRANYTPNFEQMKKKKEKIELARIRRPEHVTREVLGADRVKYFHCPIINLPDESLPYLHDPTFKLKRIAQKAAEEDDKKPKNKLIQTQYRESEAQTIPWEPDYKIADGGDPEILKLDFLKWDLLGRTKNSHWNGVRGFENNIAERTYVQLLDTKDIIKHFFYIYLVGQKISIGTAYEVPKTISLQGHMFNCWTQKT